MIGFSGGPLERMKQVIAAEFGFRHHHHRLEIQGVCGECQGRDALTLERGTMRSQESIR